MRNMKNLRLICIVIGSLALLLIPYIAMRFTGEVNWTALDFMTMGTMLLLTALAIEAALRVVTVTWQKTVAVMAIVFGFVMVWGTLVHLGG